MSWSVGAAGRLHHYIGQGDRPQPQNPRFDATREYIESAKQFVLKKWARYTLRDMVRTKHEHSFTSSRLPFCFSSQTAAAVAQCVMCACSSLALTTFARNASFLAPVLLRGQVPYCVLIEDICLAVTNSSSTATVTFELCSSHCRKSAYSSFSLKFYDFALVSHKLNIKGCVCSRG